MTQPWLDEAITVTLDEDGVPTRFVWQEQHHVIVTVLKRWELETEWWRADGCVHRLYLAVLTDRKLICVIYQDYLSPVSHPHNEKEGGGLAEEWRLLRLYD